MIEAFMAVCGANEYFNMAEYSIPSFLLANAGTKLTVFSNEPERLLHLADEYHPLEIKDFDDSIDRLTGKYRERYEQLASHESSDWEAGGVEHVHKYVSLLPVLAEAYSKRVMLLKIDVDSFFVGDMLIDVIEELLNEYKKTNRVRTLYLVSRPDNGIIKPFGKEWPGVGFMLWGKGSDFINKYCDLYMGNEQETVLVKLAHEGAVDYKCLPEWHWHVVYPYWYARSKGKEFDTSQISPPFYLHIHSDDGEHNRMEVMENLWEEFYA